MTIMRHTRFNYNCWESNIRVGKFAIKLVYQAEWFLCKTWRQCYFGHKPWVHIRSRNSPYISLYIYLFRQLMYHNVWWCNFVISFVSSRLRKIQRSFCTNIYSYIINWSLLWFDEQKYIFIFFISNIFIQGITNQCNCCTFKLCLNT